MWIQCGYQLKLIPRFFSDVLIIALEWKLFNFLFRSGFFYVASTFFLFNYHLVIIQSCWNVQYNRFCSKNQNTRFSSLNEIFSDEHAYWNVNCDSWFRYIRWKLNFLSGLIGIEYNSMNCEVEHKFFSQVWTHFAYSGSFDTLPYKPTDMSLISVLFCSLNN